MPASGGSSRFQHALNYVPIEDAVSHWIYVLKCNEFYKVGITKNIKSRLSTIKTDNPYEITVILKRSSNSLTRALRIEALAHRRLIGWSHWGEWFHINDDKGEEQLAKVIEKIKKFSKKGAPTYLPNYPRKNETFSSISKSIETDNKTTFHQTPLQSATATSASTPRPPPKINMTNYTTEFLQFCRKNCLQENSKKARDAYKNTK